MRLKLRLPTGNKVIEVDPTDTVGSLLATAATLSGGDATTLQLLTGYPPTPIMAHTHSAQLADVGISKGGTCIVKLPAPAAGTSGTGAAAGAHAVAGVGVPVGHNKAADPTQAAAPAARVTSPSTRACPACTFINPSTATSCAMCTGPLAGAEAGAGGGGGGGGGAGNRARAGGTGGDWKFEVKKMPDDNSCLFHAVGFLLGDGTLSASQLRGKIVDAVKASPDRWSAATLGKPIDEYCAFILNPIRWGGQVELAIFAELFQAEISVTEIQSGREDVYGQGQGFVSRVYIMYSGLHFDAVAAAGTTVFSPTDTAATAAAKRLALQLKGAGKFADAETMQLRCKVCNTVVNGDYEARLHAGTLGHKEFAPV